MTIKSFVLIFFVLTASLITQLFAQTNTLYPVPQNMTLAHDSLAYHGIYIRGTLPDNAKAVLQPFVNKKNQGTTVVRFKKDQQMHHSEGYALHITKRGIQLNYADNRGAFYGAETLRQLLSLAKSTGHLQLLTILDYPDISRRGVVEGFYGHPWSFEDRIAQLQFYGRWKMNTYIYGPKDDLYHSSPNWRMPYPGDQAARLKKLIQVAKANEVDFYWAIHPGKDIQWNNTDSLAVIHKLESMYDLGVRHFAVFFDDISGEGTKAEKQAGLLNYIQQAFVDKKKDIGQLIMCPTEYNKLWADPKRGTYLDILGAKLDKRIAIMWTGNSVIHDISREGQLWVNKRIKRNAFVWWNFPVNDYVRNHLLLGSVYGLDMDMKADISGFVSNPMDKPEASKVALFSVADFCWNNKAYNAHAAWLQGIAEVVPHVAASFKIFAENNTDPGPSYHKYRRLESVAIAAELDSLLAVTGQINSFPANLGAFNLGKLGATFATFEPAAKDILQNAKNRSLVNEVRPWLLHFSSLGQAGRSLITLLHAKDLQQAYAAFLQLQTARNQLVEIDKNNNRNPYQPGIVTGGRHILPWIEKSYFHFAQLFRENGFQVPQAPDQATGEVITSMAPLQNLPLLNDVITGNKPLQILKLGAILEVIKLRPNDYIGIKITSAQTVKEVHYEATPKSTQLKLAYSSDGHVWTGAASAKSTYVRLLNSSDQTIEIKLNKFEVVLQ